MLCFVHDPVSERLERPFKLVPLVEKVLWMCGQVNKLNELVCIYPFPLLPTYSTPPLPSPPLPFHLSCHVPYMHVYTILHVCILGVLIEWMCVYGCMCSPFHHAITYQGSPSLRHTAGPVGQTCLPRLPSCPSTTALGLTPPTTPLRPPGVRAASHAALLRPSQIPTQGGRGGGGSESEEGFLSGGSSQRSCYKRKQNKQLGSLT